MDNLQIVTKVKLYSAADTHPNKQPFTGILCSVGSASTKAPHGSAGKKVILSSEATAKAINTLKGMPLNVVWDDPNGRFTGHQQETVIGIIANAWIQENDVWVEGYLFPQNYPQICASVREERADLGFSYEVLPISSETKDNIMIINEFTFIGACMLYKDNAAYSEDTQLIAAQTTKTKDGNDNMDEKMFQAMMDTMFTRVDAKLTTIQASFDSKVLAMETKIEASAAELVKANAQVEELAVALAETKDVIKAAAEATVVVPVVPAVVEVAPVVAAAVVVPVVAPAPTILAAGQTVVGNGDFAGAKKDKATKIAAVHASAMSIQEKLKAVVMINAEMDEAAA